MTAAFCLLEDSQGRYRDHAGETHAVAGDACMWTLDPPAARPANQCSIRSAVGAASFVVDDDGDTVSIEGDRWKVRAGPNRLPSEHLDELRANGFTVLDNLLDAAAIDRIKAEGRRQLERHPPDVERDDGRVGIRFGLAWSTDVARAVANPVAHWLLQTYLDTDAVHFCHPPSVTVMRPARETLGTFPDDGWHSDYPYHPGIFPGDHWPSDRVYGVQFNVCIDEFRSDNAATQFVPGSHFLNRWPPRAFNEGGTRMGEGVHRDVRQMLAPAGSALIYDARTWHRACDELNVSGTERFAILNAVAPAWVIPMGDKTRGARAYLESDVPAALTPRERETIERLCNQPTQAAPPEVPQLTPREYGR